jgi:hypothetical protein
MAPCPLEKPTYSPSSMSSKSTIARYESRGARNCSKKLSSQAKAVSRSVRRRVLGGAPEEIRTHDPQIRRLLWFVVSKRQFCKKTLFRGIVTSIGWQHICKMNGPMKGYRNVISNYTREEIRIGTWVTCQRTDMHHSPGDIRLLDALRSASLHCLRQAMPRLRSSLLLISGSKVRVLVRPPIISKA